MSTLRERVEGLVAKWRKRSANFIMQTGNPAKLELEDCANELAAALVAEGQGAPALTSSEISTRTYFGPASTGLTPAGGEQPEIRPAAAPSLHKEGAITVTSAGPNGPSDLPTAEMEEPTDEQESSDEFTVREIIEACAKDLTEFQQLLKRADGGRGGHGISIPYSKGLLLARNFLSASPAGRAEPQKG